MDKTGKGYKRNVSLKFFIPNDISVNQFNLEDGIIRYNDNREVINPDGTVVKFSFNNMSHRKRGVEKSQIIIAEMDHEETEVMCYALGEDFREVMYRVPNTVKYMQENDGRVEKTLLYRDEEGEDHYPTDFIGHFNLWYEYEGGLLERYDLLDVKELVENTINNSTDQALIEDLGIVLENFVRDEGVSEDIGDESVEKQSVDIPVFGKDLEKFCKLVDRAKLSSQSGVRDESLDELMYKWKFLAKI